MNVKRWAITVFASLVIFAGLAMFKVTEIQSAIAFAESFPEPSETVESTLVKKAEYVPSIQVMGEVLAPRQLEIRNELPGEIVGVFFKSGANVEKNQVLIQQDISIETANLAAAEAKVRLAKSIHERAKGLHRSKAGSKDQLDRAKAELTTSLAEVEALKRTIDKKTIRAPFSGKVGLHRFEVGQYILDNQLIASLVGETETMWVDFKVLQFYPVLKSGQTVSLKLINAQKKEISVSARVIAENPTINAVNRSRSYRAEFDNQVLALAPNTMVSVSVPVEDSVELLSVPVISIQQDPLGQFVFLLNEDAENNGYRAVRRQVNIKRIENQTAYISGGLSEGLMVATAGAFKLHEGLLVFSKERSAGANEVAVDAGSLPAEEEAM